MPPRCTSFEKFMSFIILGELLVLSVGPNFVAIVGEEAKRYLAIDERGKVFTAVSITQT